MFIYDSSVEPVLEDVTFKDNFRDLMQYSSPAKLTNVPQYLDENDMLIAAIFENMNANRLKDCVQ